jgi:hypothetical protein
MAARVLQNLFNGMLIGALCARGGWSLSTWEFWATILTWATINYICDNYLRR